ncbi:MAG: 30S ribosomal protein S8 [Patescibacteria group bacterium]
MTDPIADMLTRIRNALRVGKTEVRLPHSKIKEQIATVLHREGYISRFDVETENNFKVLVITLKYKNDKSVITSLKRISKSGRRVYSDKDSIPVVLNGLGIAIVSTSKGLMTGHEAYKQGIGGEVLCEIY